MIAWVLETMVAATLLMLLVLVVRRPVAELFGAQWAYALWLLPVLVPLLPPMPGLLPAAGAPVTIIIPEMPLQSATASGLVPPSGPQGAADLFLILLALWAGGAMAFAAWQQSTYSAFMLHLGPEGRRSRPPSFGGICVVESDAVDGPVAIGLFRRRIVVPEDFLTRYSENERRLALEHELVHHQRFDLLWNWVGLGLLTLNWFNPVVHIAFRAFRADQELACDAAVTRRSPSERHDYACALVKSASQPGLIAVCPLNHADILKQRLRMMKKHRASPARSAGGAVALATVGAAGLALATPGVAHEEPQAPANLIVARQDRQPMIEAQDVERLRRNCGERGAPHAVVCSDAEARDPEVHAIVRRTKERVAAKLAKVKLDRRETAGVRKVFAKAHEDQARAMKDVEQALAEAQLHVAAAHEAQRLAHIERALAHARAHLQRMDVHRIQADAMRSAMAATRVSLPRHLLTPLQVREIEVAMAEAGREIERIEIHFEMPDSEHYFVRPAPPTPPAPPAAPQPPQPPML